MQEGYTKLIFFYCFSSSQLWYVKYFITIHVRRRVEFYVACCYFGLHWMLYFVEIIIFFLFNVIYCCDWVRLKFCLVLLRMLYIVVVVVALLLCCSCWHVVLLLLLGHEEEHQQRAKSNTQVRNMPHIHLKP